MKVVLDTNIIVADYNLKKPTAKILLEQAKNGMLDVYIPEIVMDEVFNKFRQRFEQAQKDIITEIGKIAQLNDEELESPVSKEFIENSIKRYQKRLEKLLLDHKVTIVPYPEIAHKVLARKPILKIKPFNANEKGYRDNLIWENVKSLVSTIDAEITSNPELVFITDNHTDFMSGDGLHNDLIAELGEQDLQTKTIALYRSLQEFGDRVMKLHLAQESLVRDRLSINESSDSKLKAMLTEYLYKEYVGHDLSDFEFIAAGDYADDEREVNDFREDFEIHNLEVKKLNADEFVIDLRIDVETDLEFFIDKSEHCSSDDVYYRVIDYDWNDHVMLVGQTENIPLAVTLIVNSKLECQSIEVNKIEEHDTY